MRYIILDTSFLIKMVEKGKDYIYFSEEKFNEKFIPSTSELVVKELKLLTGRKGLISKKASLALKMVSNYKIFPASFNKTDEELIFLCNKLKACLATADIELFNIAKNKGISSVFLNKKGELIFSNG